MIRFSVENLPSTDKLKEFTFRHFNRLKSLIDNLADGRREVFYNEPEKPEEGQIVYADGTSWNPGNGSGYYWYDATLVAWRYMGVSDFMLDVAKGLVPGTSGLNKFGRDLAIAGGGTNAVWDGSVAYVFPATADITHIVGTAGDTQTIEVQGLDVNWALVVQTKALVGATPQVLDTPLRRIFRMKVIDTTAPAGAVIAQNVGATTTYAQITAGNNQTLMAIYTVPADVTLYLTQYYATLNRASGGGSTLGMTISLWVIDRANNYVTQIKHIKGLDSAANSAAEHAFKPYFKITEKSDVYIEAANLGAVSGDVSAGFDGFLVDN